MSMLMDQARNRVPRMAEAAVERARLSVVPRRVQKAPKVPFVSLVSLLLVTGVLGLLLFNTSMQQASFTATSLEQRAAVLDANEQALQMEIETLRDPQKVANRARQLGMVPRTSPAFIRLPDGKVLGNPKVARPEDAMQITPLPTRKPKSLRPEPIIVRVTPEASGRPVGNAAVDARDTTKRSAARSAVSGAEPGTKKHQREAPGPRRGSER